MQPWIKEFLDNHNDNNTFVFLPIPQDVPADIHTEFNWITNHSHAPWLQILELDMPYQAILAEAQSLKEMFVYHRGTEDGHIGWRSLAIHGIEATKTNVPETYGLNSKDVSYDWTEIQDRCPVTVDYFKNHFPYKKYQRLRFMLVEAGGHIAPHRDNKTSHVNSAVNISLNNPVDCRLTTEVGTLPFEDQGSIFLFNNYYEHAVHNNSTTDRYHIIVHGEWDGPRWQQLVVNSYKKAIND